MTALETKRLILREWKDEDVPFFVCVQTTASTQPEGLTL